MLAQASDPSFADPFGMGVVGVLLAVCIRLIWVFIQDLRTERARMAEALDKQREATLVYAQATEEMIALGRLMRKVLEALPQADETPPPRSTTGRGR
jgi:hypothetical protein